MDQTIRAALDNLRSEDREEQNSAYYAVIAATDEPVDWAYEVWDAMIDDLAHHDNHRRAIAAQVLCNLAKSDPDGRMLNDFDALLAVTKDERFVTARHCLQAIWKIGAAGKAQQAMLVQGLSHRFGECVNEKNGTLIRYDIIVGFKNLYDKTGDDSLKDNALALIATEEDPKYRKKYGGVWRQKNKA